MTFAKNRNALLSDRQQIRRWRDRLKPAVALPVSRRGPNATANLINGGVLDNLDGAGKPATNVVLAQNIADQLNFSNTEIDIGRHFAFL